MKVPRGFESHPLRQRVPEAEKIGAPAAAKSPRSTAFSKAESPTEKGQPATICREISPDSLCFGLSEGTFEIEQKAERPLSTSMTRASPSRTSPDKGCSPQVGRDSSMASRLEQLNRIAVGIFNLNLFATGADLDFISKTRTRLFQLRNARRQILDLKEHTVPSAGLLLTAIAHWSRPRCPRTAQD